MSMNLNAATKNTKIDLWQTPTQISYTILPPSYTEVKGVKAKEALERYIQWVQYSTNGTWESLDALEDAKEEVRHHIAYVGQYLEDKSLRVWVL